MHRLVTSRAGAIDVQLVIRLLGMVAIMGMIIALGATFFGPQINNLASVFGFQDSGTDKAIDSAQGLALATSCTAIINAHASGSDKYQQQWTDPFNLQGWGSSLAYSCEDTVPQEGEPLEDRGVWFAPPEENGVHVTCDSYDTTDGGHCEVRNFELPQEIGFVQDDVASGLISAGQSVVDAGGELLSGDLSGAGGAFVGAAQEYIMGWGMPSYVLYYQSVPSEAEQYWLKRGDGINGMALAIGLGVEVATLGLAPGGSGRAIARMVGDTVVNSRVTQAAAGGLASVGSQFASVARRVPGAETVEGGIRVGGDAVYTSARFTRRIGAGTMRGLRRIRNLPSVARAGLQKRMRYVAMDTMSFIGTKLAGTNPTIIRFILRTDAGDDLMADIAAGYSARMSRRLVDEGMAGLTRAGGGTQGAGTIAVRGDISDEVWERQYAAMAEQSLRDAVREAGDAYARRGEFPLDGDDLLRHMDAADGRTIGDFAQDQAQMLTTNREITSQYLRTLGESADAGLPAIVRELPADDATAYMLRARFTLKGVSEDFLARAQGTGWRDGFQEALEGVVPEAFIRNTDEIVTKWSDKATALCARAGANAGCREVLESVATLPCNSPAARQEVMDEVWGNMDGGEKAFWKSAGQCTQYSATSPLSVSNYCGASVGPTVAGSSAVMSSGQAMCGYMSFMGYMADHKVSQTMHRTPAKINSMYLQSALGPAMEIPLHPIANWYFVGLIRGGGNPNSRFMLASPFSLEDMAGTDEPPLGWPGDEEWVDDPHIDVKSGSMSYRMTSAFPADQSVDPGEEGVSANQACDAAEAAAEFGANVVESALEGTVDSVGTFLNIMSGGFIPEFEAAGWLHCTADTDNDGDTETVVERGEPMTVEQAMTCGKQGTFLLQNNICDDELLYIDRPQVRRVPGPNYTMNPGSVSTADSPAVGATFYEERDQEGGANTTIALSNVDVTELDWNKSNTERQDGAFTARSFNVTGHGQCDQVEVRYCTQAVGSVWSDLAACSDNEYTVEDMTQAHKFTIDGSEEIYNAGIRCHTDAGTSGTIGLPMNVQKIKEPSSGERYGRTVGLNYFQQLWYWNDELDNQDCEDDGNCRFNWIRNWNDEQPKSDEVRGDGSDAMLGMYPTLYSDGYGTTQYTDPNVVSQTMGRISRMAQVQEESQSKSMRAIQISTAKTAPHGMWITEDGDAIYGYNADITSTAVIRSVTLAIALGVGILSGGTLTPFLVGAAEVITAQMIGVTTAWPNH